MNTTPPEDDRAPRLVDTGKLLHSIGFSTTPLTLSSIGAEERQRVVEAVERRLRGNVEEVPPLKLFNPDDKRVFSKPRPGRHFPGNAPGPKGAA